MMVANQNNKPLLPLGILTISLTMILNQLLTLPDLLYGLMMGTGIGMIIVSLLPPKKRMRLKPIPVRKKR